MSNKEDYDESASHNEEKIYKEEKKIANILLYGTPAAKQEIIVKLICYGNITALNSVLYSMSDAEYNKIMPTA